MERQLVVAVLQNPFSIVINRRADVFGHFVEAEEVNFQNKNPISNGNIL